MTDPFRSSLEKGILGLVATALMAPVAGAEVPLDEMLWRHRNLGKAFFENPATQYQAAGEFEKALALAPDSAREQVNLGLALLRGGRTEEGVAQLEKAQRTDPTVPHTWFNLGIEYKRASRYDDATAQLEKMVTLVPDEPISHYNLGVLYKLAGETDKALAAFERASALNPNLAGPRFQLATTYRQLKRPEDSKREMTRFRELKKQQAGAAVPEDLEWSWYSEIYDTLESMADPASPLPLRFREVTGPEVGADAVLGLVADATSDQTKPVVVWASQRGAGFWSPEGASGQLAGVDGAHGLATGDVDNDGRSDLLLLEEGRATLWRREGDGFVRHAELAAGRFGVALFVDVDHDYDLDALLFGVSPRLMRNDGERGWSDQTADFPFRKGPARAAVSFDLMADTQGTDVLVSYADRGGVLYRDRLLGRYEAVTLRSVTADTTQLLAADVDHDGWTDIVAAGDGVRVLRNSTTERFDPRPPISGAVAPAALADYDARGSLDLDTGAGFFRHRRGARFASADDGPELPPASALEVVDLDGDSRPDRVAVTAEGHLVASMNAGDYGRRSLRLALRGVKNLQQAPGAEIEVKAGQLYQKQVYRGQPLIFGLGDRAGVDAIRISWPNGLIQNETGVDTRAPASFVFEEAQRLSGSCPMIFTWDGGGFRFITDILGVAPLGASAGDGHYFPVDADETIQIPPGALVERDGHYEIRITEELREIAYLDRIRLHAVDRPKDLSVFINDKFIGPPFPEFRLWGVGERHYPVAARDHRGRDVLGAVSALDRTYPDGFERDFAGVAEMHTLELDFGDVARDGEAILVLSGWVDWADGSTFRGAATSSELGLVMPSLEMRGADGTWQTVIADMGIPAGKPKTIVVDLSDLWPSDRRAVRIVSNLAVYWDEIFLGTDASRPDVALTELERASADIRFRGFSRPVIHPRRLQPESFVYADRTDATMWNPTPGLYTRYGDVMPLITEADDRFVIMGSGDEVRLLFKAAPQAPDTVREFLLTVDGWAKDGDANTAHSQTVGPLPFRGMPQYPYAAPHAFPSSPAHEDWRRLYNVRPALRVIRPLHEGLKRPAVSP
ncbi:MAG: tetratricopeptide repeat protein [Acidobacteriota bacterium]